jgi:RNA recognition motif-containing protein
MGRKLYVTNLKPDTEMSEIRELFGSHGKVQDVRRILDADGTSRGGALVTMGSGREAREAAEALDGTEVGGQKIEVREGHGEGSVPGSRGGRDPRSRFEARGGVADKARSRGW